MDCLLGTGFSGPVRGAFQQAIQAINRAKAYVVSVDINSGMNGDTGKGDLVVRSDLTVTIGYLKAGMFLGEAVWKVGRLVVADIGIRLVREDFFLATPEEMVFPAVVCLFRAAKLR
ncbi:MAG: NAD(P)H-hydrate epimerase [Evtepia gabavorous]